MSISIWSLINVDCNVCLEGAIDRYMQIVLEVPYGWRNIHFYNYKYYIWNADKAVMTKSIRNADDDAPNLLSWISFRYEIFQTV